MRRSVWSTVHAYQAHKADRIVAEVNNGGDLVEAVLRNVDHAFAYRAVHTSRGKLTRARNRSLRSTRLVCFLHMDDPIALQILEFLENS